MNCLIVDDEPLARAQLVSYLQKLPEFLLMGTARTVPQAQQLLSEEQIDLIFLDIKMPGMSGIEFLRASLPSQQVIIISAYPEYALEGFELEVTDYLMKPVSFERFAAACRKALTRHTMSLAKASAQHEKDFMYVKCEQRVEKLEIGSILYLESMLNYVSIYTTSGRFIVHSSLKAMEKALPTLQFLRIHKSYLIACQHVQSLNTRQVTIGQISLPVSRSNRHKIAQLSARL